MKILLSAVACNPFEGSEGYVGWAVVQCLAQDHELWVITNSRSRSDLERAARENLIPKNVHFVYAGHFQKWHQNRMRAKLQGWNDYLSFTRDALDRATELHRQIHFDLAHHVTLATWRVASPLWKLGIPFIFGPVAGNEQIPFRFFPVLSASAAAYELLRKVSGCTSRVLPSVRNCIRRAAHVLVATAETERLVLQMRGKSAGVSRLSQAFYPTDRREAFTAHASSKDLRGVLRLFAGGFLEGRKCVAASLRALAEAKLRGVNFRYRIAGHGPESENLHSLVAELGLQNEVILGASLSGDAYRKELGETHVYLLPSLRESAGLTMMEAMLAGCVPVVANSGGPAAIVTEECGFKIRISNPKSFVNDLTKTIVMIDRHREIIAEKGQAASRRIANNFTEENYRATINALYVSVTGGGSIDASCSHK